MRELGWGRRSERLSVKEDRRGGGSVLGSDLIWKILWIRIRQNDADPVDPDPQHCLKSVQCTNREITLVILEYENRHSFISD